MQERTMTQLLVSSGGNSGNSSLTLSLLMSYIYGALSKARNLTSYIYGRDFLLEILLLEPCISLIYA
jgi:hypothetical protein